MVIIEKAKREDILRKKKNKGLYIEKAKEWLEDFLNACQNGDVDARRMIFPETEYSQKDYEGYYKSMQYFITKEKLPIALQREMKTREIGLVYLG